MLLLLMLLLCLLVLGKYLYVPARGASSSFHLESTICMTFQNFKTFANSNTARTFKIIQISQHVISNFLFRLNYAISESTVAC